ncbi:MAG: hypothetical protein H7329_19915 [Opitutaceae bacterium]|nr:hypothetical protein [Cytophagales bacterium]
MSRVHKFRNQEKLYFVSFATVNWIDVFIRKEYKDIVVASLKYCIKRIGTICLVHHDKPCSFNNWNMW